ncbi:PQ loop repeat-domain-containing protein [Gongronella butleri]|nr:PQ loop repeat-domain-containing protein [Gongronella butleri]
MEEEQQFLSQAFGYLSIVCWLIVFTPQLYENYTRKNTDGVSARFLWLWIFGDIFNLVGAILEHLLVTMLLLAVYYLFADGVLMSQVGYYRYVYPRLYGTESIDSTADDETVYDTQASSDSERQPLLANANAYQKPTTSEYTRRITRWFIISSVLLWVFLLGISALYFFWPGAKNKVDLSQWHLLSQTLGWASAILYCTSRIPQIMQNFRTESVEGLSIFMFVFSVVGNVTYCLSVLCKSMDRTFLLINYPWLLGSGGTLFFDFTIFFQFYMYRHSHVKSLE